MATRKTPLQPAVDFEDIETVNEWAIIDQDATSALWEKPTTGDRIKMPLGMKPTPRMIAIAEMNGAILRAPNNDGDPHGHVFDDLDNLDDGEPSSPVDRIVTLLQSNAEGVRAEVKIYRMKDGERDAYCGSFTPEQFENGNLELIRSNWGGGKYRIKVYATNPATNKFVVRMNDTIEIEASNSPTLIGGATANPTLDAILRRLESQGGNQPGNQVDSMKQLRDMLGMFVMMKQAFGGGDTPKSSVGEIAQAIREIKDIQGDLGGGGGGGNDNSLMGMGSQLLSVISEMKNNQPAQLPQPPMVYPPNYAGNPIQPIHVPENPVENQAPSFNQPQVETTNNFEGDPEMNMFVKIAFKVMLKKAAENAPVEPIAADMYKRLPDEMLDILESDMWWDALLEFAPQVEPHQGWFTALRTAILGEIAKDQTE